MLHTYPARHAALVLVKALDLGQVNGWGALHLEAFLVMKDVISVYLDSIL